MLGVAHSVSLILNRAGRRWMSLTPVSYTHLDVYKRQEEDRSRHTWQAGECSLNSGTLGVMTLSVAIFLRPPTLLLVCLPSPGLAGQSLDK